MRLPDTEFPSGNLAAHPKVVTAGPSDKTPTRYELLCMVKKHSDLLKKAKVDEEEDEADVDVDLGLWHEMLELYFIHGRVLKGRQDDDLIFFVRNMLHGHDFNDTMEGAPPFFVRRWASKLEKVVDGKLEDVDWKRSFYLNLIAHTSYTVTVAICSARALHRYQSGEEASLSPIYKVVKTVYASPSRVNFQKDFKKAVETVPAYPNICFAVDDFDDTFDAVVLSETDHCYCVLLNAHGGSAFPTEEVHIDDEKPMPPMVTLFSGFISYPAVRQAYDAGKSTFGSFLAIGQYPPKTDRLYMRGPEGRGEVEVAVSGIADQRHQISHSLPLHQAPKKGLGVDLANIVHKAASAASVLARQPYAAAASTSGGFDQELLPLRCCLMSISLPWEHIAHDLLFKEEPPKILT